MLLPNAGLEISPLWETWVELWDSWFGMVEPQLFLDISEANQQMEDIFVSVSLFSLQIKISVLNEIFSGIV